jgi:hypothetical protein
MKRKRRSADVEGLVTHATTETPVLVEAPPSVVLGYEETGPDLPTERIDPTQLLGISAILAVGLSFPSLSKAAAGRVSLLTAGWYFACAVVISMLGVWLLWAVWHTYRRPLDEQRRREWEQARAERLAALELENQARVDAAAEVARAEAEALRATPPPEEVERTDDWAQDDPELPRSLRDALAAAADDVQPSVALSDPSAGSR